VYLCARLRACVSVLKVKALHSEVAYCRPVLYCEQYYTLLVNLVKLSPADFSSAYAGELWLVHFFSPQIKQYCLYAISHQTGEHCHGSSL